MTTDVSNISATRDYSIADRASRDATHSLAVWRTAQYLTLVAGVILVVLLLFMPALGLDLLWNGLIPLAPALIVVAPGVWRNICPMATFSLLPRRWGLSRQTPMPPQVAATLGALALTALLLIIPLRHLVLNTDGPASALMLILSAAIAFSLGLAYDWRSGWCNGACPIHPAERLYGQSPAITVANARCDACHQCSTPCPDSTRAMQPLVTRPGVVARMCGHVMAGGFAGFIWGWYRIPDHVGMPTGSDILLAYAWPFGMAALTLLVYGVAYRWGCRSTNDRRRLVRLFAAAAVCTYYWYRIPMLAGFGPHAGSGMLLDLTEVWPALPWLSHCATTAFFLWYMLVRADAGRAWMHRPVRSTS